MDSLAHRILLGIALGDALGVPFEFISRDVLAQKPAKDMVGYGTHHQPLGTWSDDSALTFCLAEVLTQKYVLTDVASTFIRWKDEAYWTARYKVFDIGLTTAHSIEELKGITEAEIKLLKYTASKTDNGNGSLMRILPLIFEIRGKDLKTQFEYVWNNSSLTHKHIRAAMACMIYLKLAEHLIDGLDKIEAYQKMQNDIQKLWAEMSFSAVEQTHFSRVIEGDLCLIDRSEIKSGGYVMDTLEACVWSFLTTDCFTQSVLTAVNLGGDTDTTAACTGGLAGIHYGVASVPDFWVASIARLEDIMDLGSRLNLKYS